MSEHGQTSGLQTLMHILKANIGSGILAMPAAFALVGLTIGSIGLPLVGLISAHCMYILVRSQQEISKRRENLDILSYEQVAENIVASGPRRWRRYSKLANRIVASFVMFMLIGACCIYAIFAAENIRAVAMNLNLFGDWSSLDIRYYLLVLFPLNVVLNFITSLNKMAYLSTSANFLQVFGLVVIVYNLTQDVPTVSSRLEYVQYSNIPMFFTVAVYAFEGIGTVLPVYTAMKRRQDFLGSFGVLNISAVLMVLIELTIAFLGYVKFGQLCEPSITLNMPPGLIYESVRIVFAISMMFTFPLCMYVPITYWWPCVEKRLPDKWPQSRVLAVNLLYRTSLVAVTFVIAACVPLLELVIALVGALCSSALALIFPPILQLLLKWRDRDSIHYWSYYVPKNIFISSLGVFGFVVGTYYSLVNIYHKLNQPLK